MIYESYYFFRTFIKTHYILIFFNNSFFWCHIQKVLKPRIQPDIKESAEAILERLGIPVSVFIDMTYGQVIMHDGVPFLLEIPQKIAT